MKTLILAAFMLAAISSNAQFNLNMGIGVNVVKKVPAAELSMGYDFKVAFVQAGFLNNISRKVDNGTVFFGKLGHSIQISEEVAVQPSFGYSYTLKSNELKGINESGAIGSLYLVKKTRYDQLQLFAGGNYLKNALIFAVGIRFNAVSGE